MKTLKKLLAIACLFFAASAFAGSAQIVIKGEVVNSSTKVKEYTINVYEKGKLLSTHQHSKNTFIYSVPSNKEIMLEFIADGHYTKRIAFDSNLEGDLGKIPRLDLKMNLVEKNEGDDSDEIEELLDMPTAFITYNEKKEYYDKNYEYSKIIKKELEDLLAVR